MQPITNHLHNLWKPIVRRETTGLYKEMWEPHREQRGALSLHKEALEQFYIEIQSPGRQRSSEADVWHFI